MATATTSGGETRTSAGFIGSLAHTPLAEVVRRLVIEERSGDLQVTGPSAIKTIYFDRGFIVFASSSLNADRFGESMIEAGRISRHEFALASMLMRSNRSKFGQALVDAGIISDEELGCNVALQVNRIVLSLFSFKRGMYSFDERPSNIPVEMMVSLSSYRILVEGVRHMSSKSLVATGLPPLDTEVRIVDQAPFSLDIEKLRPVEKQVLRSVGDGAPLKKIVETVGGEEGVALRACYGLICGGILEAASTEGDVPERVYRVQEETGTFVLSEIRQKVAPRDVAPREPKPSEPRQPEEAPLASASAAAEPIDAPPIREEESSTASLLGWLKPGWEAVSSFVHGLIEGADETDEQQHLIQPPRHRSPLRSKVSTTTRYRSFSSSRTKRQSRARHPPWRLSGCPRGR